MVRGGAIALLIGKLSNPTIEMSRGISKLNSRNALMHPNVMMSLGGHYVPAEDDDADTPNTQSLICQWDGRNTQVTRQPNGFKTLKLFMGDDCQIEV